MSSRRSPTTSTAPGCRRPPLSARGRVQLAQRDPAACATLRTAVARWTDLGVPYEIATARTLLGQACRDIGDETGAASAFDAARQLFDDLGVGLDARHASTILGTPPLPAGLTAREAEVLRLVAAGHTNKEVAAALFLSDKTIARHLSNIFTKAGVSTRAAATAFAFENGVIPRDRPGGGGRGFVKPPPPHPPPQPQPSSVPFPPWRGGGRGAPPPPPPPPRARGRVG